MLIQLDLVIQYWFGNKNTLMHCVRVWTVQAYCIFWIVSAGFTTSCVAELIGDWVSGSQLGGSQDKCEGCKMIRDD